ncbi:MAG: nuclear transport factor 2 family protein [Tetrasphaera sp.]
MGPDLLPSEGISNHGTPDASLDVAGIADACHRVVVEFAHRLDHREFDRAAALFTPDGVWHRHGEDLVGTEQILETISARPPKLVERHVMTTIHVEVESADHARATAYVLIVRGEGDASGPVEIPQPQALGEFHDRLRRTAHGWRIAERSSTPVFVLAKPGEERP